MAENLEAKFNAEQTKAFTHDTEKDVKRLQTHCYDVQSKLELASTSTGAECFSEISKALNPAIATMEDHVQAAKKLFRELDERADVWDKQFKSI